jgi:hypothetical protein
LDYANPEDEVPCRPRPLAQGALGQVLLCAHCRQVHLQVGALTLRLTHEAFGELAALLQSARGKLEAIPDAQRAAAALWH